MEKKVNFLALPVMVLLSLYCNILEILEEVTNKYENGDIKKINVIEALNVND